MGEWGDGAPCGGVVDVDVGFFVLLDHLYEIGDDEIVAAGSELPTPMTPILAGLAGSGWADADAVRMAAPVPARKPRRLNEIWLMV